MNQLKTTASNAYQISSFAEELAAEGHDRVLSHMILHGRLKI